MNTAWLLFENVSSFGVTLCVCFGSLCFVSVFLRVASVVSHLPGLLMFWGSLE